jgi:hypothetical protein
MADIGSLNPEQMLQQQQILRQQKMAEMLMQQGAQQPQGQMVSGRYVAPSIFQNIAGLANMYMGQRGIERAEKAQIDLAKRLRADETSAMADFMQRKEAGNVDYANLYADPRASAAQRQFAFTKMNEGPIKVGVEDTLIDPRTMKPVFTGAGKPRAPLQIDTGTAIELRDPNNPTVVLQRIPKSQMPTAGQVVERDDGTFLIDTRTGQARPVMGQGGQPLVGGGKPLNESQANSVAFGARALQADKIITNLENKGVKNTGLIRSTVAGTVGATPFIGERLESGANALLNITASPEQQQTRQARQNFITAVLRKESGATIRPDEFKVEEEKYFPTINDDATTIKQKQEARQLAIEALKAQAGPSGVRAINQITSQFQSGNTGNVVDFNSLPKGR